MKIGNTTVELKRVSVNHRLSEETNCFVADIWIDGKKVGDVRNDGHGGCNMYTNWEVQRRLGDLARTLPPVTTNFHDPHDPSRMFTFQPDADHIIGELIDRHIAKTDLKRLMKTRIIFTKSDRRGIFQSDKRTPEQIQRIISDPQLTRQMRERIPNADRFLNMLPFEEAVDLFLENSR